ncbi:hypothetical protein Btru_077958 [Bulinus truncatus]|nr:hypothetical protein Btru_077958 [Bulinus truncatus]
MCEPDLIMGVSTLTSRLFSKQGHSLTSINSYEMTKSDEVKRKWRNLRDSFVSTSHSQTTTSIEEKRRIKSDDTSSSSSKVVTVLDYESCMSKKELDRIDCYFWPTQIFFKLSHKRQIMVKMKMAEIFNEAELLQLEEDEDNS